MNIAIIGGSGHWKYAANGVSEIEGMKVTAISRTAREDDVCAVRACFPEAAYYDDWRELLDKAVVDIAVVNGYFADNAQVSAACLARGIPVYSEKPLATTLPALEELEQVFRAHPAPLGGMFDGPHRGWFRAMEKAVCAGEIGEIRMLHAQKSYRMSKRGRVYRRIDDYGGMLGWVGIHGLSWIVRMLDGAPPETAVCAYSDARNRGNGEMQTSAAMLLTFPGQVIATVTADYFRPDGSARHDDDRMRITGTRGMIEVADGRVFLENECAKRELPVPEDENPFACFVRAVQRGAWERYAKEAFLLTRTCLSAKNVEERQ